MTQVAKRLKQDEKKVVLSYVQLKLKANRLNKELDTIQDEQGNSFGLQKINRKRKKFETANFKIAHNDLYNKFTTEIVYSEYKAIGDNNGK